MLLIRAIQVENNEGTCTYKVTAFINTQPIWEGIVGGHQRSDGWAILAAHIAFKAGLQSAEEARTIEQSLKVATGELVHCPACNKILGYAK